MPIPFQDVAGEERAVAIAYLRFMKVTDDGNVAAALFIVNGQGEPLEFCFTRVVQPSGPLWEPGRAYRRAVADLAKALFEAANHEPDLLLALADEAPPEVFVEDLVAQTPAVLVAGEGDASLRWLGQEPEEGSVLARLVESLRSRSLLLEPFERAAKGLEEAYPQL